MGRVRHTMTTVVLVFSKRHRMFVSRSIWIVVRTLYIQAAATATVVIWCTNRCCPHQIHRNPHVVRAGPRHHDQRSADRKKNYTEETVCGPTRENITTQSICVDLSGKRKITTSTICSWTFQTRNSTEERIAQIMVETTQIHQNLKYSCKYVTKLR